MRPIETVGKRELKVIRIEEKTIKDLRGTISHIEVTGDINESELPGYDEWH